MRVPSADHAGSTSIRSGVLVKLTCYLRQNERRLTARFWDGAAPIRHVTGEGGKVAHRRPWLRVDTSLKPV
jgi:hypothetical protein